MKALIIGGNSLLGKYLSRTQPDNIEAELTWYTNFMPGLTLYHLDINNHSQVSYTFSRVKPDVVIHCSALGSVDYAENNFAETHMTNVVGTKVMLKACRDFKAKFVYISTNAVFAGELPPYSETSERHPINAYGVIKKEAEQAVMASDNWIIIRPFLLYGWPYPGGRENWLTIISKKLLNKEEVRLVGDTFWQPTLAEDCASAIWQLIQLDKWNEVYHVASDNRMSLFEFGLKVAKFSNADLSLIQPIASSILRIAPRPRDSTFDLTKIHNLGIHLRDVEEGLERLKNEPV